MHTFHLLPLCMNNITVYIYIHTYYQFNTKILLVIINNDTCKAVPPT